MYGQVDSSYNYVIFIQGDSLYKISKEVDSIVLYKQPFAIRYFSKKYEMKNKNFYSAQIAVFDNTDDIDRLEVGQHTKDIPYYEPGTGITMDETRVYESAYITNTGHNYLTYENKKNKAVNLISQKGDMLELEWIISKVVYKEKIVKLPDLQLPYIYFSIFIDRNLNDVIDENELKKVKVTFK